MKSVLEKLRRQKIIMMQHQGDDVVVTNLSSFALAITKFRKIISAKEQCILLKDVVDADLALDNEDSPQSRILRSLHSESAFKKAVIWAFEKMTNQPLVKLSGPISSGHPPSKHRALAQRLHHVLMEKNFISTKSDFVGGINALEEDLVELERDGLLKVHDQFYQD